MLGFQFWRQTPEQAGVTTAPPGLCLHRSPAAGRRDARRVFQEWRFLITQPLSTDYMRGLPGAPGSVP